MSDEVEYEEYRPELVDWHASWRYRLSGQLQRFAVRLRGNPKTYDPATPLARRPKSQRRDPNASWEWNF